MQVSVTSKGQFVIPAALRKKYNIQAGTRLRITDDGEKIMLQPVTPEYIDSLIGFLKGSGALQMLIEERQRERILEDGNTKQNSG